EHRVKADRPTDPDRRPPFASCLSVVATAQDRLVGFCTRLLIRGSALGALAAVQELGNFGERYRRTSLNYGLPTDSSTSRHGWSWRWSRSQPLRATPEGFD